MTVVTVSTAGSTLPSSTGSGSKEEEKSSGPSQYQSQDTPHSDVPETAAGTDVTLEPDSEDVLVDRLQTAMEEHKSVEKKLTLLADMVQGVDPQEETPILTAPHPPSADRDPIVKAALVGALEAQVEEEELGELVEAVPASDGAPSSDNEVYVVGEVVTAGQVS